MRLASVIHLYRVRLRSRLVQELLALAGIAVGVALVFAALVANTSLTGSVRQLTGGVVGDATLQLAARGPDGFDQRLLGEVERIDGVAAAAPVLETRANIVGPNGRRSVQLFAGGPRFARLGGPLLRVFAARERGQATALGRQQGVALPAPMASELGITPRQPFHVEIGAHTVEVPLGLPLSREAIGGLVQSPLAIAPLPYVQRIADMRGRITRVFVKPDPGREGDVEVALRRLAADRLNVRAADADVAIFAQAALPTNQSTALFSVFSAMVGFLFAFSAMLLTVPQRRRLIADLQMAGHEPWVLVQLLLFDALVLGFLGSLLGLGLGDLVSRHLFGSVPGYLSFAFPVGSQRVVSWESVAIAVGAGVGAACIAVIAPLRDSVMRHPLVTRPADRAVRVGRWMLVAGGACLAGATVVAAAAPDWAVAGIVMLTLALLLLLPALLRVATAAFEVLGRTLKSPVPTLAILELRSRAAQTRTLALAATGAVAVFATVAIGGAHADLQRGLDASAKQLDGTADIWATFRGPPNAFATTPFAERRAQRAAIERLPGVRSVSTYRGSFLDVGDRRAWVIAPPRSAAQPVPPSQIESGDGLKASARIGRGGWVTLSEAIADEYGVGVGDRVRLPSPSPRPLRVAAVTTNLGWPPGAIVLNADDYARAWSTDATSALQIAVAPGASAQRVKREVGAILASRSPLLVETKDERTERHYDAAREGLSRLTQISVLVIISAVLAMATAMGGMMWQRRRTLAGLKVHGYSERELWSALMLESGLLLGTGCLIGAAFGLFGQILLSRALAAVTGFPVFYSAAGLTAAAILALVTLVAVAMLAVPGWLIVRVRPQPGLPG